MASTTAVGACGDTSPPAPAIGDADGGTHADVVVPDADGGTVDASTCALPGSFGSTKCNGCVATTCCDELTACQANAACGDLLGCILACLDSRLDAGGCARECFARHSAGTEAYKPLESCWFFEEPCAFLCGP